jgi:hypothetical protein
MQDRHGDRDRRPFDSGSVKHVPVYQRRDGRAEPNAPTFASITAGQLSMSTA